jgi:drug/metabolite transporter (DMT)-like permease
MFTVLAAHVLTANEKLTSGKFVGVMVGFAGVAALVAQNAVAGIDREDIIGEVACLAASLVYAFAGIYGRRFTGISPVKVATGRVTGSTLVTIPLVALADRPWTLPAPGAATWGALVGIALLCTVLAYILYFRILAVAGATNLLLVTFLSPVSAIMLGWFVLGEALLAREFVGIALIGVGLTCIDGRLLAGSFHGAKPVPAPLRKSS